MSKALVITAIVVAVMVLATGGMLSVKSVYAIDPVWGGCTGSACPGDSGFTTGYSAQINNASPNVANPGHSSSPANDVAPGIVARTPQ